MTTTTGPKLSLRYLVKANSEGKRPDKLTAVVVGATSGIGESTCYKFAEYVKVPTIYLLGRNEVSANRVIANLKNINSNEGSSYTFIRTNTALLKEDDAAVAKILAKEDKISSVIVTAGFLGTGARTETAEGLDLKMATHYYGRWRIISGLLPALQKSAELGEPSIAMTVLGPELFKLSHPEDLELKHHYNFMAARSHNMAMNTYAVKHFAKEYPKIAFAHLYPGLVDTNIDKTLPWYTRYPLKALMRLAGFTAAESAERIAFLSITNNNYWDKGSEWLVDQNTRKIVPPEPLSNELETKVWDHTRGIFDRICS